MSAILIADGKKIVLPLNVSAWDRNHVKGFIIARFSDETHAETSLCNLLTYGKAHSACNAVLSALERFLQKETGRMDDCILTPGDCERLKPMINEFLDFCREKIRVIPQSSVKKVLVRT